MRDLFLLGVLVFTFVFFFKQKTAYEMRISDWSSDVCSSDLQPACRSATHSSSSTLAVMSGDITASVHGFSSRASGPKAQNNRTIAIIAEIGRASCRERVCQYV